MHYTQLLAVAFSKRLIADSVFEIVACVQLRNVAQFIWHGESNSDPPKADQLAVRLFNIMFKQCLDGEYCLLQTFHAIEVTQVNKFGGW